MKRVFYLSAICLLSNFSGAAQWPGTIDSAFVYLDTLLKGEFISDIASIKSNKTLRLMGRYGDLRYSLKQINEDGSQDFSFGINGTAVCSTGNSILPERLKILPDNKILVAGFVRHQTDIPFIARHHADGRLDSTFGTDGITTFQVDSFEDRIFDIQIQPDGKILAFGYSSHKAYRSNPLILRFQTNGSIDYSFGENGIVLLTGHESSLFFRGCVLTNGKIIAVGKQDTVEDKMKDDFLICRFLPNGLPDVEFDKEGKHTEDYNDFDLYNSVSITQTHKILTTGTHCLHQYRADGKPESSFGISGKFSFTDSSGDYRREIDASKLQKDGKILFTGSLFANGKKYAMLGRCHPNGFIDSTFGSLGLFILDQKNTHFSHFDLDEEQNIVVSGMYIAGDSSRSFVYRIFSNVVTEPVDSIAEDNLLNVYPNPVQSNFEIEYLLKEDGFITLQLCNISGQKVLSYINHEFRQKGIHKQQFKFHEILPRGNYFLVFHADDKKRVIKIAH